MKTTLFFLLATAGLPLLARAQSPTPLTNANFETWSNRNGVEAPTSWLTIDDALASEDIPPILLPRTVTKSSDAHGGSFAAQVQNQSIDLRNGPAVRRLALKGLPQRMLARRPQDQIDLPGLLLKGSISEDGELGGVPYTGRPTRLQFWYKLTGPAAAADSAIAGIILTRQFSPIAEVIEVLAPQSTYTLMDMPITYQSTQTPDSLQVAFVAGTAEAAGSTSRLFVDDVQLVGGTVTGTRNSVAAAALLVYPNPSTSGEFSLASLTDASLSTAPFTVTDATGRLVLRQPAAPARDARGRLVDLRAQQPGVYLLRLEAPAGPVVRKLVVQ
ncbi:T9SS type A sorting domain-containing protein [Hymenobacter psychrophilus]|uniref:Por secretion system C-terminal sorting domain-containing protein n=1 Tax=Hymenobacter psychrophilus TaxID=651662 RepID=A0A1H3GS28_9BACT|nr:T9SS type A sorting domain-containing protein [Hymenobacter psychrophilus]SDY05765.1 Por secretion system C-terminal sorting domain-containing protein [Hymenobacter psychrophilus]